MNMLNTSVNPKFSSGYENYGSSLESDELWLFIRVRWWFRFKQIVLYHICARFYLDI